MTTEDNQQSNQLRFYAQPPPAGVSSEEWARAFLEAQSPNPSIRQRGRDALTSMGCQWSEEPAAT